LPRIDHAPQRQRHAEEGLDDLLHRPLADVAAAAEIGQRGRQIGAEGMGQNLRGDRGPCDVPATGARAGVALMLRDDREDLGQFRHRVPSRLGIVRAGLFGQRGLASFAPLRHAGDYVVHPLGWQAEAMMSGMSRLPAGLSSGGRLGRKLWHRRRIGRRRNRRVAGVGVEAGTEFANFGLKLGDLGLKWGEIRASNSVTSLAN